MAVKQKAIDPKYNPLGEMWHSNAAHQVLAQTFLASSTYCTIEGMLDADEQPQSYAEVRDNYISSIKDCALDLLHDFIKDLEQQIMAEIKYRFEVKLLSVTGNETGITDADVEIIRS